ncbi:RNA polymerase sigma-70 factor [Microlunatus soli]|uniref:RNA polymerase sigma-70 factor, ECF subfamily n=1 Tax=Microlunatus soli TaxID=630515 RepID=A0A1H1UEY6_9ACTN|nr:RNA polymerase sigma-70 factor [Microlunatus soli]SDS71082.1 RNA polymerase sigma-70 factor, ECF subfamily [Microlunatus soli]
MPETSATGVDGLSEDEASGGAVSPSADRPNGLDRPDADAVFAEVRPRLFGIAYRMTGSVADAEDLVQEVWIRWQATDRSAVRNPPAYLATAITRLAINTLTTARARRESYVGPWLPEPVDTSADPQLGAERTAALDAALLLLMEKLTPTERAGYVLREAFDYPYEQIAEIVQTSEVAARQLVSRARKRLAEQRHRPVDAGQHRRLLESFITAARTGDLPELERLFRADVVSYSDGGGTRVRGVAPIPVSGATTVARFLRAFAPRFWPGVTVDYVEANGGPAALLRRDGAVAAMVVLTVSDGGIEQILWQLAPSKINGFTDDEVSGRPVE